MKEETLNNKIKRILRDCKEQLFINKLVNLEKMYKFLET
jgi:hypothetical protein